jgi:tetratricopeptide (TPR) repeat protein
MSDVFISHVREDSDIALEIARGLEAADYTTWYYERNSVPGVSYLLTTKRAVEESRGVLVIISAHSLASQQMTKEVVRAHESDKPFIPVLRGVSHDEFQQRQPEWREAMGAAASLDIPPAGVSAVLPRIIEGLKALGIHPKSPEERAAEARARERAQRLQALLRQADQATEGGDWDKAVAALNEYLSLAPDHESIQARLLETQQKQRTSRLVALRLQAESLTQAEKWEQAVSAWRAYLAQEPEDKQAAQADLQHAEKLRAMAGTYGEAQAALAKKNYDRAITLLKGLVVQDETYKQASGLLAKAIELRRGGGRPDLSRWLSVGLAGAALVALAVVLIRALPSLVGSRSKTPASPTATAASPAVAVTPVASTVAQASPTRAPATKPATPSTALEPKATATAQQPLPGPTSSSANVVTAIPGSILVPDAVVGQFFSPGPDPAALAVASDALWVWDDNQRLVYKLDRTGNPLGAFPITFTNAVLDLAWDGAALRLTLDNSPDNLLVVRLDSAGGVLESFLQPTPRKGIQAWSPADGSVWQLKGSGSENFILQFSADGRLLQSFDVSVFGSAEALAWAADGLWVISIFGDCYRFGFDGQTLSSTKLSFGDFPYQPGGLAVDQAHLWLVLDRTIYQVALRQNEVRLTPTPPPGKANELALPRPQIAPATIADKAIVQVTNHLGGAMTLSFGDESAILQPNDTWSGELNESVYTVFASANVPQPIAFSDRELLLAGYEYTWVLQRPE